LAPTYDAVKGVYDMHWQHAQIMPARAASITNAAKTVLANKTRYQAIEKATGIPWFLVGCLHMREAGGNFRCHLHNGDPLSARTYHVPAGRPVKGSPPFTWEDSAIDALCMPPHEMQKITDWSPSRVAYEAEKYNGWGYNSKGLNSPYDWSGIDDEAKPGWQELAHGKYVADHVFDASVIDQQPGVMSLIKVLMTLDPTISFGPAQVKPVVPPQVIPAPAPVKPVVIPTPAPVQPVAPAQPQSLLAAIIALLMQLFKRK
jgi:lysozyme family protein